MGKLFHQGENRFMSDTVFLLVREIRFRKQKEKLITCLFFRMSDMQSAASRLKSTEFGAVFFRKPLFLSFFSYFCAGNVSSPHI